MALTMQRAMIDGTEKSLSATCQLAVNQKRTKFEAQGTGVNGTAIHQHAIGCYIPNKHPGLLTNERDAEEMISAARYSLLLFNAR